MSERRSGSDRRRASRGGRRASDQAGRSVVLLIDDHAGTRELIGAVLASSGIAVVEAATCAEALRRLGRVPAPSAILVDIALADCNGPDVIRTIRANPDRAAIPVLALSASATAAERQAALDAGSAAFLPKPVSPHQLLTAVQDVLGPDGPSVA